MLIISTFIGTILATVFIAKWYTLPADEREYYVQVYKKKLKNISISVLPKNTLQNYSTLNLQSKRFLLYLYNSSIPININKIDIQILLANKRIPKMVKDLKRKGFIKQVKINNQKHLVLCSKLKKQFLNLK